MCHTRIINTRLLSLILIQITSNLFGFFISNNLNDFLFFFPFVFSHAQVLDLTGRKILFSHSISKVLASHPDLDLIFGVSWALCIFSTLLSTRMLNMILSKRIEFCGFLIEIFFWHLQSGRS